MRHTANKFHNYLDTAPQERIWKKKKIGLKIKKGEWINPRNKVKGGTGRNQKKLSQNEYVRAREGNGVRRKN